MEAHEILGVSRTGMLDAFREIINSRGIQADEAQERAVARLQKYYDDLLAFKAARRTPLRKLLIHPELPRGVYLWGGVGRGKSLLMDCFYGAVPYKRKRRVHFHEFMREVHDALSKLKNEADPLRKVAENLAHETRLLCLDEFHVSDIADAMILGRLLECMMLEGVLLCMTSNYPPDGLYPNGLQRQHFLPTIELLNEQLDVIEVEAGVDYRKGALAKLDIYRFPVSEETEFEMGGDFEKIAGGAGHQRPLDVMGRSLSVKRRAPGVVWFDFWTLCGGPRSQNDYLELAHRFHTVFLSPVPRMGPDMANEARRFTWLVDVFYDQHVKLIISADCEAYELYSAGPNASEFHRTVSRLIEMRSPPYMALEHRADLALNQSVD